MTFRFLHLADLHLETRFGGREATRTRLREATREAFIKAVDFALERDLHAVLIAGDAYDDPLLSRRTELFFVSQLRRLAEAGLHVFYACGNHDPGGAAHRAAKMGLADELAWAERVHVFRSARPSVVRVLDEAGDAVGVVVGAGHATDAEERNLAARFHPLESGVPVVGLLHTQVAAARRADEHALYAPSTREDLAAVDYDYWALGHVHLRQQPFADLPAWYPGNLQGRHRKETGPKGGLLVELEAGEPVEPAFVPFAPVRWERIRVRGLLDYRSTASLIEHLTLRLEEARAAGFEAIAAAFELAGETPLAPALRDPEQRAELELELLDRTGAVEVQILDGGVRRPRDLEDLNNTPSVLQKAKALLERAATDPRVLARLAPKTLAGLEGRTDLVARAEYLTELLDGLDEELFDRCLEEESA